LKTVPGGVPVPRVGSPARRVRLPAARRRRQILDVALDVFAAAGFHGTSMDDVADAVGVTKPVLYHHFSSKRELYLELLEDVGGRLMQQVISAVSGAGGPRQQVEAGMGAYFQFVLHNRSAFRLLFASGPRRDEEFAEAVQRVEDAMAEAVASLIEADLDDDHRRLLGHAIVGLAEGASRAWVTDRVRAGDGSDGALEAGRMAGRLADLAWAGLRGVHRD
jgi:AcrR family transcriptional regulator